MKSEYELGKQIAKELANAGVSETKYRQLYNIIINSSAYQDVERRLKKKEGSDTERDKQIENEILEVFNRLKGVLIYSATRGELASGDNKRERFEKSQKVTEFFLQKLSQYKPEIEDFRRFKKVMEYATMFFKFYSDPKLKNFRESLENKNLI